MVDDTQFAQLQQRVALLERQVDFLLGQAHLTYVDRPTLAAYQDVAELKRQGNIIEAIKVYRSHTGVSLLEAKLFVDNLNV
jgi:ribosomal protein L7/L12